MSKSKILDALRNEERSLRSPLVAIQRHRGDRGQRAAGCWARQEEGGQGGRRRKRTMSEKQRRAVADRMRKYWASRREAKAQQQEAQE